MIADRHAGPGMDADLAALLEELTTARARARDLERELVDIVGSPTWRLAVRLRASKRRITEAGPLGSLVGRMIRIGEVTLNEGPRGLTTRARQRLRQRLAPAPAAPVSPRPLPAPIFSVPPMVDASGVSIVLPVTDLAAPVYECLKSLVERTAGGHYEVIVVDDTASDHMPWVLAHFEGLRLVRNETARGPADSLGQGARLADGRFLLFLSPYTLLLDDWLPPLVDTLKNDPSIGAVGPRLRNLAGTLHGAGDIVWSDGSACSYGRGDDPHRPGYLYRRDVDSLPLSCLLARRHLLVRVGGLDAELVAGGNADIDLAFALRALGYRVVYQPLSQAVHVDPGPDAHRSDPAAGAPRERLAARHGPALAAQYFPHPSRIPRARDRQPGLRILIVDHMVPMPDRDAGSVRMLGMLRLMAELGHAVTFVPDNLTPVEPYTGALQQMGVEVIFGEVPILDHVAGHLRDFDLILLCRATIAGKYLEAIRAMAAHPPIVFDTVDLHFLREERHAALLGDPAAARLAAEVKAAELALARSAQAVWVVSPHEAQVLREEDGDLQVEVVPLIQTVRTGTPGFAERRDLVFVGGFRHPPNEDAVRYFASAIFPLVRRELPDARFLAVGPEPPDEVRALGRDGVEIAGYLADLDPVLDRSRVFVAPLRFGAGLKGKIVQSLACGLPVVTTSVGAEGLGLVDGDTALIADDPAGFAAAVLRLHGDEALWTRLSEAGRRHVDAAFGPGAVKGALDAALRGAATGPAGQCSVCGYRGLFLVGAVGDNPREALDCPRCGAISRDRFMAAVLAATLGRPPIMADWPVDRAIVIREPSAYRARAELLARKTTYQPFKFPEENLEMLKDADCSIDHLITADVFEHVRRDDLAFREVHRVLKPGGCFFLQVPYSHTERTLVLVEVDGDRDVYLGPPQYHDEDTLVYRIYGHDLLPKLEALGFSVGYVEQALPEWAAPRMNMIVCRKGAELADDPAGRIRFDRDWPR